MSRPDMRTEKTVVLDIKLIEARRVGRKAIVIAGSPKHAACIQPVIGTTNMPS